MLCNAVEIAVVVVVVVVVRVAVVDVPSTDSFRYHASRRSDSCCSVDVGGLLLLDDAVV
jgi:hypothetical protein